MISTTRQIHLCILNFEHAPQTPSDFASTWEMLRALNLAAPQGKRPIVRFLRPFPTGDKKQIADKDHLLKVLAQAEPSSEQCREILLLCASIYGSRLVDLQAADVVIVPTPPKIARSDEDLFRCLLMPWLAQEMFGKSVFWINPPLALLPGALLPAWKALLCQADLVWVDDPVSLRLAQEAGCERAKLVPDPIMLTIPLEHGSLYQELEGKRYFCVTAVDVGNLETYANAIARIAADTSLHAVLVPAGPRHEDLCPLLAALLPAEQCSFVPRNMIYQAVAECLAKAAFLLSDCPTLAKLAAVSGTPCIPVNEGSQQWQALIQMLGAAWHERKISDYSLIREDAVRYVTATASERVTLQKRVTELQGEANAGYKDWPSAMAAPRNRDPAAPCPLAGGSDLQALGPDTEKPAHDLSQSEILPGLLVLTVYLRRGVGTATAFRCLQQLVEDSFDGTVKALDTRWLSSVCDSYADNGDSIECRNALLISTFLTWERIAASYVRWATGNSATLKTSKPIPAENEPLWDGLITVHLRRGDTLNNLLMRYARLLRKTPALLAIWRELIQRIRSNDSVLAALEAAHHHLWDENLSYFANPELEVPSWKRPPHIGQAELLLSRDNKQAGMQNQETPA